MAPLVLAALGHAGGQGSSAYSQRQLWAPSRVPEVNSREVPKWMEDDDIAGGDRRLRRRRPQLAVAAGCDGVEVNAGQHSLVRQFLSGLTNHRGDEWGQDRTALRPRRARRGPARLGADGVVGLRLSCDELAPWAGITPEQAPAIAAELAAGRRLPRRRAGLDLLGRADPPRLPRAAGFNVDVCRAVRAAVPAGVAGVPPGVGGRRRPGRVGRRRRRAPTPWR